MALALSALGAVAEHARAEPLTLDTAIARALAANPSARAARLEALAAHARTAQAYARHLGDADVVGVASRYESPRLVKPLAGPVTPAAIGRLPFDRDQLHYGVAWQIPLFAGGALVEGDKVARLAEASARATEARSLQELRYNVGAAYRNVLAVRHALAAAIAHEKALAQDEASARLRVETEAWSHADAAKVSFALASAQARRAGLTAQLRGATSVLAALIGDDSATTAYELEDVPAEPSGPVSSAQELAGVASARRADLLAARDTAEAQRARVDAVRAGFWPQLAFAGNTLFNDAPSVGSPIRTWELTIQLKIPLLGDVGRELSVREAEAAASAAAERSRAKALEVESQAVDATGRVESARAALVAGKAQRELGAEAARVEELRFQAGTGRIEDHLAARASALEGETGYWQALYALQSAYDYLELVSGMGGTP